ncbi:MAG: hypothetical protein AB1730_26860 [Myxococcota bacterium]
MLKEGVWNTRDPSHLPTSGEGHAHVISPLLPNICLHFFDAVRTRQCAQLGVLVRYAGDFVICKSREPVVEAERRVRIIFERLELGAAAPDVTAGGVFAAQSTETATDDYAPSGAGCLAGTVLNGPGEPESISLGLGAGETVYRIVDGELASRGAFDLEVTIP